MKISIYHVYTFSSKVVDEYNRSKPVRNWDEMDFSLIASSMTPAIRTIRSSGRRPVPEEAASSTNEAHRPTDEYGVGNCGKHRLPVEIPRWELVHGQQDRLRRWVSSAAS
jgi:hypothetical protein